MEDNFLQHIIPYMDLRLNEPLQMNRIPLYEELRKTDCNLNRVLELLNRGSLGELDEVGNSALHNALLNQDCKLEVIQLLIEHKAPIEDKNGYGNTPLHVAVKNPNSKIQIVEELLKYNLSLMSKNEEKNTPLHCAVLNMNYKIPIVRALIDKGAKLNVVNNFHDDILHSALRNRNCGVDLVRELLENGAQINEKYYDSESAIFKYLLNPNCRPGVVEELLKCGADISKNGRRVQSVLHYALDLPNHYEIISTLLETGNVNINATNIRQNTVLHRVLGNEYIDQKLVFLLLEHGAGLYIEDKCGNLPLHKALSHNYYNIEVIHTLLEKGAYVCKQNAFGLTPLGVVMEKYKCNRKKYESYIKLLLTYAVKNNFEDSDYNNEPNFQGYNLDATLCPDVKLKDHENLSRFIDQCCRELVRMRTDIIDQEFSLFDFICNTKRIIRRVKLENVLTILCYNNYPIYKNFIVSRLDKSELLEKIHEQKVFAIYMSHIKNFSSIKKVVLNQDCVNKIVGYLCDEDILNLAVAFYEPIRFYSYKKEPFKRFNRELPSFDDVKRLKLLGDN